MENNFLLSGDEARILMSSLLQTSAQLPAGQVLQLYIRLANISNVQPPKERL